MAEDANGGFPRDGGDAATARGPEPASPRPVFVAPAMVAQTGASMVHGGRRMSGRVCLTWKGRGTCAFGDACRFLHPAPPSRASPDTSAVPPLGYVAHKAQQQLGADPSRSLLAEVLESGGLFRRVKDPSLCSLLWSQSFTTGALYDNLPDGAFVNHFPNSVAVTHKHRLVLSLRATPGGDAVAPEAFLLPAEADAFAAADNRLAADDFFDTEEHETNTRLSTAAVTRPKPKPITWIVKRSVGGEGQGIAVCKDAAAVLAYVDGDFSLQKQKQKSRVAPTSLPVTSKPERDKTDEKPVGVVLGASHVVQRYVPRPLRVFGRKVDMRVYVLVTSWGDPKDPEDEREEESRNDETEGNGHVRDGVRAYAYAEGLVRFAAAPYDVFDADVKKHLTNNALATAREHQRDDCSESGASGAVGAPVSREGPDAEAHFKRNWSFETFGAFLDEERGAGSFARVWTRVVATARVAVEAARPAVTRGLAALSSEAKTKTKTKTGASKLRRHFELLGLDVLVDEDLRVWLLEVNSAPSLVAGTRHRGRVSETHHALKGGLLADAMNLLDAGRAARGESATTEAEEAANELERARQGRFVSLYG